MRRYPALAVLAATLWSPASGRYAHGQLAHLEPAQMIQLASTLPPYDVSTVKVNDSSPNSSTMSISDSSNSLTGTNVPVEMLIAYAYNVKADRISGIPGTLKDARFDVHAKVLAKEDGTPPKLTDQQLQAMIIPLLADRFRLHVHLEQKTMPIYELVAAHGGLKIKLSTGQTGGGGMDVNASNHDRVVTARSASLADLAGMLSDVVHRNVIDKTGLPGRADLTLKWTSDEALDAGEHVLSIFTALEEQLGLKLVSSKGPVDVLVIDHIEMPTAN